MREQIEKITGDVSIYDTRKSEFETGEKIPFRVSPTPFPLTPDQKKEIENVGKDIVAYFQVIDEMCATDSDIHEILNTGKPELFLIQKPAKYLFVRPDIIITDEGFRICEIETSPFGLALAEILNKAYRQGGFETLITEDVLPKFVQAYTPSEGRIVFSRKTEQYKGQMTFLAEKVFSGTNRNWNARKIDEINLDQLENIYRGFYLGEYMNDDAVRSLLEEQVKKKTQMLPSLTPQMEEKTILSFIWDKRFENRLKASLGVAVYKHLREVIPPNWIVGQEKYFAPGLPGNMDSSMGLATLSHSKRAFVLKSSGFSDSSSWGEGVNFLHHKSTAETTELFKSAINDKTSLYVVQHFEKGSINEMKYIDKDGQAQHMSAKIRLTPYFSAMPGNEGRLVAIKATGRENTDFIHGASDSINTAVS